MSSLTTAPPVIADPLLRRLYQYWDHERGNHPMPTRDSVDPIKMRYILGHLALIDVIGGRGGFRIRLHGTELVSRLGDDLTGKTLDELPFADQRKLALAWFTAVAEQRAPLHEHVDQVVDGFARNFDVLVLPYSTHKAAIDLMLLAIRCRTPDAAKRPSQSTK
ncbi:MAG: PAS domain-containing protein [Stellaceae bacterium]